LKWWEQGWLGDISSFLSDLRKDLGSLLCLNLSRSGPIMQHKSASKTLFSTPRLERGEGISSSLDEYAKIQIEWIHATLMLASIHFAIKQTIYNLPRVN
jgi:hypothetical protein